MDEEKKLNKISGKKSVAYIFYHNQAADVIFDEIEEGKKIIEIFINWGYFYDEDMALDSNSIMLVEKIKKIALQGGN